MLCHVIAGAEFMYVLEMDMICGSLKVICLAHNVLLLLLKASSWRGWKGRKTVHWCTAGRKI